ncbi:hypothetical protein [Soonwooa sp.]|uniref:hypothetical protein n=1 Tax=Soonwooa sp. TaxID=1938592 RepID=UPI0035B256F4
MEVNSSFARLLRSNKDAPQIMVFLCALNFQSIDSNITRLGEEKKKQKSNKN